MGKDTHVAELGLERAVECIHERTSFATKTRVEVASAAEGLRAAGAGADVVLFDNFAPPALADTVEALPAVVLAEASGGITVETVPQYAATGVEIISPGSLTHSAPALDYSFHTG